MPLFSTSFPFYIGADSRFDYLIAASPGKYEFTSITIEDNTAKELDHFVVGGSIIAHVKDLSMMSTAFGVELKYEVVLTDSFSDTPFTYRNNAVMLLLGVNL